jgi:anti-anti-sigma factor
VLTRPQHPADTESFRCEVEPHRDVVVVRPHGELDLATLPLLDARLAELRDVGFDHLVVDLGALTFMDVCAVALLVRETEVARLTGARFEVVAPGPGIVDRLLDVLGLWRLLPWVPPIGAAAASTRAGVTPAA